MADEIEATAADLLGLPQTIEFEGKEYTLRKPDLVEQGRFGRWLERRALDAVARAVDLPEHVQDKLYATVMAQIAGCVYEYFSAVGMESQNTPVGRAKLLQLILSKDHPEVTEEFALRMVDRKQKEITAILATGGDRDHPKAPRICVALGLESSFLSSPSATRLFALLETRSEDLLSPNSSTSSG